MRRARRSRRSSPAPSTARRRGKQGPLVIAEALTRGPCFPPALDEDLRLVLQQPDLALEATAEPAEGAIGTDDPVAGHDDRQRVAVAGGPDRAGGEPVTDGHRDLAITTGLAVRDARDRGPDRVVERGARTH